MNKICIGIVIIILNTVIIFVCISIYDYEQTVRESDEDGKSSSNILVSVAVCDTGVDLTSNKIRKSILVNEKELEKSSQDNDGNGYTGDYWGWNFYNNTSCLYDDQLYDYHGTYICNKILEIAPDSKIIPVKFMNGTSGTVDDAIKAIKYAIERGADIVNCSWGFYESNEEMYTLIEENKSVVFVCATGNVSLNLDTSPIYPACYELPNVISVTGTTKENDIYPSSGYGMCVDVAAPADNISVIFPEDEKTTISGTSIASAQVTALASLIKSKNSKLKAEDIKRIIMENVDKTQNLNEKCKASGCINIRKTLKKFGGK